MKYALVFFLALTACASHPPISEIEDDAHAVRVMMEDQRRADGIAGLAALVGLIILIAH